jgi:hypothetical protein
MAQAAPFRGKQLVISGKQPRPDYVFGHYVLRFGDVTLLLSDSLPVNHLNVSSKYRTKHPFREIPDASRSAYCCQLYFNLSYDDRA